MRQASSLPPRSLSSIDHSRTCLPWAVLAVSLIATALACYVAGHAQIVARSNGNAVFMTAGGITLSLLLFAIAQSLTRALTQAIQLASTNAEQQRHAEIQLERVQAIAHFGNYRVMLEPDAIHQTTHWSAGIHRILGCDPSDGPSSIPEYIDRFIHVDDQARTQASIRQAFAENGTADCEYRIRHADGSIRYIHDRLEFLSQSMEGSLFFGVIIDITECKQAEFEKLESAARFQSLVEQLPGVPYIANLDHNASILYVSPKIEQLLGFTPKQLCGDAQLYVKQLHPEDRSKVLEAFGETVSTGNALSIDYRIFTRTGKLRWFHDQARIVINGNGQPLFMQGVVLDITERKQAQLDMEHSHLELQKMIDALDALREDEQKRLAQEMHDDLGQLLAAMKMDLATLRQRLPQGDSRLLQQLGDLNALVDTMVLSVRRIIADLPPKILDELGLFKALEFLVATFEKRYRTLCRLELPEPRPVIEAKIATPVYRMVQEALNNVARHAQATCIDVQIDCHDGHLKLCVTDNGKGMSPEQLKKAGSFGLVGMRERVTALGGEMSLESADGSGTAIRIAIPMSLPEPPAHGNRCVPQDVHKTCNR